MYRRDTSSKIRCDERDMQIPRLRGVAQASAGPTGFRLPVCALLTESPIDTVWAVRLAAMPLQRQVIDYALARRALLVQLSRGQLSAADVCDAHPDLQRAARYHGEATEAGCPICRKSRLTRVTYAYGDELLHASGRARSSRTLDALAQRYSHIRIYVVEVCRSCGWNHLTVSYLIGTAVSDEPPADTKSLPAAASVPDSVPVARPLVPGERRTARR
jgi:hypothetical protein